MAGVTGPLADDEVVAVETPGRQLAHGYKNAFAFFGSYGIAKPINGSVAADVISTGIRWSIGLGHSERSAPAFALEVMPMVRFQQAGESPVGFGFNLMYEQRFSSGRSSSRASAAAA